jgi:argininosuccinate synthase
MDRRSLGLKDELALRYADLVYEGRWWTAEREALDALVNSLMRTVTGRVRMKLFKGNTWAVGRSSPMSLYREDLATFGASAAYDHADATGFIKLFSLPTRARAAATAEGARSNGAAAEAQAESLERAGASVS